MEIKNSLINTKSRKKQIKLNKKMQKKSLKYKNIDITKCSLIEQSLFGPKMFNDKVTKNETNKFLKFNKHLTLLYLFPKSNVNFICNNFRKMFYENPMNKNIFSTIVDNDFDQKFESYNNFHKHNSYGYIGNIKPKSISEYVDYINITIFNFSYNYFGMAFDCVINKNVLQEINKIIDCNIEENSEYRECFMGNKKIVVRYDWNPDIVRASLLSENIIELKCVINDFLNSYLKFEKKKQYSPISLNIYETNYEINDKVPSIMFSHNMHGYTNDHKFENFNVWESFQNKSDKHFKTSICFESYHSNKNVDRSTNIYIYTKSNSKNLFLDSGTMINIYILILHFYKNNEFEKLITNKRNSIFSIYTKKQDKKIYKSYNRFIYECLLYQTLLTDIVPLNDYYINDYLKNASNYQDKISNELFIEYKKIEKYYEDKLSIKNIIETRKVSYISLFIAIISIIIAIIPIIYDNISNNQNKNEIIKINSNLEKTSTNIIENNSKIEDIKEQLNKIVENQKKD